MQSGKKCFVIATHSPYMLDIRAVQDLQGIITFQPDRLPRWLNDIDKDDIHRIQRMLPKLNTHQKQFFFATRPVFVEGYTDQQFVALLQELRGCNLGAGGVSVVDVGGKAEIDTFYRLCNRLNVEAHVVVDYDVLFEGRLRQTSDADQSAQKHLQNLGLGVKVTKVIGEIEQLLDSLADAAIALGTQNVGDAETLQFLDSLRHAKDALLKRRRIMYLGLKRKKTELEGLLPARSGDIGLVLGKLSGVLEAFRRARVHVLGLGELENYLPSYTGNPYDVADGAKARCFLEEREFLLSRPAAEAIEQKYKALVILLDDACGELALDVAPYLETAIGDWIHAVQSACVRGEVTDLDSLRSASRLQWPLCGRILSVLSFDLSKKLDKPEAKCEFSCTIRLLPAVDPEEHEFTFTHETVPSQFRVSRRPTGP
ncbi:MAG: TOPRIM nucleotidyl transferase/hydrolase domain-containing protein [Bacteroidota bacterium]